jgi:hypothetical protein
MSGFAAGDMPARGSIDETTGDEADAVDVLTGASKVVFS